MSFHFSSDPSSLSLSYVRGCNPFSIFMALHWPCYCTSKFLLHWAVQTQTHHSRCALSMAEMKNQEESAPWTTGEALSNAAWLLLAAFTIRAHCWLTFHLMPTSSSRTSSAKLLSSQSPLSLLGWVPGAHREGLTFPFVQPWRFLLACFNNLARSYLMTVQPPSVSATPHLQIRWGYILSHHPGH